MSLGLLSTGLHRSARTHWSEHSVKPGLAKPREYSPWNLKGHEYLIIAKNAVIRPTNPRTSWLDKLRSAMDEDCFVGFCQVEFEATGQIGALIDAEAARARAGDLATPD